MLYYHNHTPQERGEEKEVCGKVELAVHHLQQRNGRISTSHTVTHTHPPKPIHSHVLQSPALSQMGLRQCCINTPITDLLWHYLTLTLWSSLDYNADSVCSTAAPAWLWHRCHAQRTLGTPGIVSLCAHPKQHGLVPGSRLQQHANAQLAGTWISSWSRAAEHQLAAAPRPRVPPACPHLPVLTLRSCLPWEVRLIPDWLSLTTINNDAQH